VKTICEERFGRRGSEHCSVYQTNQSLLIFYTHKIVLDNTKRDQVIKRVKFVCCYKKNMIHEKQKEFSQDFGKKRKMREKLRKGQHLL